MILILTAPDDTHADHVAGMLRARGADVVRFDPAQLPSEASLSLAFDANGQHGRHLRLDHLDIDLDRIVSVWYRRPADPVPHAAVTDPTLREYVTRECKTFAQDAWESLDCLVVPARRSVLLRAQYKASQLRLAGALGFELPPTLISNDPAAFLDFYRAHNGNLVTKRLGPDVGGEIEMVFSRYTEPVSRRDVGYANALRYCPVIVQAYVPKRLELRITVVGDQVFAAEIHSQESHHTRHDWRHYDDARTRYQVHDLPVAVRERCVRLVAQLGLRYGAIDMILTPDGRYVFLEINPNGQYLWIEEAAGLPISEALCDLLVAGRTCNRELMAVHYGA